MFVFSIFHIGMENLYSQAPFDVEVGVFNFTPIHMMSFVSESSAKSHEVREEWICLLCPVSVDRMLLGSSQTSFNCLMRGGLSL